MTVEVYFLLTGALACAVLLFHILTNQIMSKIERTWFTAATGVMIACCLLEAVCNSAAFCAARPGLFSFLLVLELVITPLYMPFKCLAFGRRKIGCCALVFCGLNAAAMLIAYFTGHLFHIDAAGHYSDGYTMTFVTPVNLLFSLADLIVLYLFGRDFQSKNPGMLIGIYVLTVLTFVLSAVSGLSVTVASGTISFILAYVYYDSLRQLESRRMAQEATTETIQAVVNAIDAKDEYTRGHSRRVAEYSRILAERLGYQGDRLNRLYYAAALHDVGKIGIPDNVLNKAGRLEDIEFTIMKEHSRRGSTITKQITLLPEAYYAARNHHERYDGHGYPDHLAGKDIPEIARIITVADTYDAMNSDRIYRKALPKEVVRSEMVKGSGTQFDPDFVKVFLDLLDSGALDEVAGSGRADMAPVTEEDDFTKLTRDIMEFFLLKKDYTGEWDADFNKWEQLESYIKKITGQYQIGFSLVVVSIRPADDRTVTEEQQENALGVMQASAEKLLSAGNVCARISLHQLVLVFREDDSKELSTTMQDIMIYFYKIFESEPFSIGYYVIEK